MAVVVWRGHADSIGQAAWVISPLANLSDRIEWVTSVGLHSYSSSP
jgi:hypothetical protein